MLCCRRCASVAFPNVGHASGLTSRAGGTTQSARCVRIDAGSCASWASGPAVLLQHAWGASSALWVFAARSFLPCPFFLGVWQETRRFHRLSQNSKGSWRWNSEIARIATTVGTHTTPFASSQRLHAPSRHEDGRVRWRGRQQLLDWRRFSIAPAPGGSIRCCAQASWAVACVLNLDGSRRLRTLSSAIRALPRISCRSGRRRRCVRAP